jgi:predicted ATP-grasp superfamily ATP-dependent carboligase
MTINDTKTPVVVLRGVESASHGALGIVRSLGRLGVPVHLVACDSRTPGFFSRYCKGRLVCNVENGSADKSLSSLLALGGKIGRRAILIPTDDNAVLFVADHAEALREQFLFPPMCPKLIREVSSKKGMYYLAKQHGVPTPEAAFPKSRQEVLDFISRAQFPVMLKAIYGSQLMKVSGQKMFIVQTEAELLEKYDALEDPANPNLMIQEYIPGGDDTVWMFDGYFNEQSDCLLSFTGKKIRQYPVSQGSTSLGICLQNETVRKTTTDFMKKIGYKGILDIGYRYDARDGLYKVLDINPRIGSTFRLFVAENGMDVARALYMDLTGQQVLPGTAREGRKWIVEDQDFISCLRYHREGNLTFRQWIDSFRGVEEAGFYASDDLYPCVTRVMALCGQAFKKLNPLSA